MYTVTRARGINTKEICTVDECMSVRSWVNIHVGEEFPAPTICLYQGKPLLRTQWETTLIQADVTFVPLPMGGGGGGGKNVMQMIGMAVVMVLASLATWGIGGVVGEGIWGALGVGTLGWGATAGYIAGAVVMIAGSLLINALFPTTPLPKPNFNTQSLESASPTYSTSISQNQARLYQMIPESFGTNMQVPDLAAQYYAEFSGNEQYLYALLCIGIGEYQIHKISIEDTPIWENGEPTGNFPEIDVEIVNPGERVTLFPDNVETSPEVSNQSLNLERIGPIVANSAGTQASALAVDVILPRGLGYMNDNGGINSLGVSLRFEAREIDDAGNPVGDWFELVSPYYSNATQTAQRFTHIVNVPLGRYQVQAWCTGGGSSNPRAMNEVVWAGLKAYLPSKLVYPDITLIALRIRATNALSQQSSRLFHVLHTRKLPIWHPVTGWSAVQPTNSWAWAMAWMCKALWGGRRTDRQIDLNALYRLDQELTARGDEFCHVLDTRQTIWDLFRDACRCVRAIPRALGSTISWMRDNPNRLIRGVFTPYNIIRDSFTVEYRFFTDDSPDDVILDYVDRDNWMSRDVHVRLPDSLSMEPAHKRFMGITSRAQAWREACFEAACNEFRRIFLKWSTEFEGRLLYRGDMVLLTHPLGGEDPNFPHSAASFDEVALVRSFHQGTLKDGICRL